MVLVQVAWVWGARLHLGGYVMRGRLGLHARGRAGVRWLGLGSGRGLWRPNLVGQGRGHRLALQVWGRGHLLRLLRTHGIAVLGR